MPTTHEALKVLLWKKFALANADQEAPQRAISSSVKCTRHC